MFKTYQQRLGRIDNLMHESASKLRMMHDGASRPQILIKDRVLQDINAIRAEFMLAPLSELPKGMRNEMRMCVVARALAEAGLVRVNATIQISGPSGESRRLTPSPVVAQFIRDFDNGAYPELIA